MSRMMQQFHDAKAAHPGMLVLFRNGDFYELFEDDAELGARVLGIHLTKRDGSIPMAGVPVHKLEHYLGILLRAGHRVAVCEQMGGSGGEEEQDHSPRGETALSPPAPSPTTVLLDPRGAQLPRCHRHRQAGRVRAGVGRSVHRVVLRGN